MPCGLAQSENRDESHEKYGHSSPIRREFFKTIERAVSRDLSQLEACANAQRGVKLAVQLTRDPIERQAEREMKKGYILEDVAKWAMMFLSKSCSPETMTPLVEELVKAETVVAGQTPEEPGLANMYLLSADFYLNRVKDEASAAMYFDRAVGVIPKIKRKNDEVGISHEWFFVSLAPYEQMLKDQPLRSKRYEEIQIFRVQQHAQWMNDTGNHYLRGVYGPPSETGLRQYEVDHAVGVFTKAIDLIPTWAEPYRGRARAYDWLLKHDLAAKDRAKAKALDGK